MKRRSAPLVVTGVPASGAGQLSIPIVGRVFFLDTVNGNDRSLGYDPDKPIKTMAEFFDRAEDNDAVVFWGRIREQLLAPLGVQGVKIIGGAGGGLRHDDGARWDSPASPEAGVPLLTLREQGWELHNFLSVPADGISGVRIRRAEDATYPDGGHAIIRGCKFVSDAGIGVEDYGGSHNVTVEDCVFAGAAAELVNGIKGTNVAIANPLRWLIRRNRFIKVTNAIQLAATQCEVSANRFTDGTIVVNTFAGAGENFVIDNYFANTQAELTIANGYRGHASDIWRNFTTTTAAQSVGAVVA